jgi:SAM-dependent methyltransferase
LHFPAVEEVLGDVNKKRILDIGCGDGLLLRLLAEHGAAVVGYDRARQQIAQARARVGAPGLDATFVVATPQTFFHDGTFDAAVSVMVLNYATSPEELATFFRSASRHLGPGGRFISVVYNPLFSAFGVDFVVRRYTRLENNNIRTDFLDRASGRVEMTLEGNHQYTSEEFERGAISGEMKPAGRRCWLISSIQSTNLFHSTLDLARSWALDKVRAARGDALPGMSVEEEVVISSRLTGTDPPHRPCATIEAAPLAGISGCACDDPQSPRHSSGGKRFTLRHNGQH